MKNSDRNLRVRYHLQNGKHKNHWQFKNNSNKLLFYIDPKTAVIRLTDCVLINKRSTADQIYCGKTKTVCAWINHSDHEILSNQYQPNMELIRCNYNPKTNPFWNVCDDLGHCYDIDNEHIPKMYLGVLNGSLGVYCERSSIEHVFSCYHKLCCF